MSELISTNPSQNYQVIGSVAVSSLSDVQKKVAAAHKAKKTWQAMSLHDRIALLRKVTDCFMQNREKIAALIAKEMGKPLQQAYEDIDSGLASWHSYFDTAEKHLAPQVTFQSDTELHKIYNIPYGVSVCISPWNFPVNNLVWGCGQSLVVGNTVIYKPSEEVPLTGQLFEQLINSVLPEGVFNAVFGGRDVGENVLQQEIDLISFTGSSVAGIKINQVAAQRLIPANLELGGSSPGVIFADVDVPTIIDTVYQNRFYASGQVCCALKRLIVHESQLDKVVAGLTRIIQQQKLGDASDPATTIGPLVSKRQLELLEQQVADAVAKGAKVIYGGKRPANLQGAYYEPTVLTHINASMRVWNEEVFGPVLPIITFQTEEQAIQLANDTCYGLGAYVFTNDPKCYQRVAMAIESGMVCQNNVHFIRNENFFGGCKMSGHGRTNGPFGFAEVTQQKLIVEAK